MIPPAIAPHAPVKAPSAIRPEAGREEHHIAAPIHGNRHWFPTPLSRAIVLAALLSTAAILINGLLAERFSLLPVPNAGNNFAYRLDKLTGAVYFCSAQSCSRVPVQSNGGN